MNWYLRVIILILLTFGSALPAWSADTAANNMLLAGANSAPFTTRLQYLLFRQARAVLTEAGTDASHNGSDSGANATDLNYDATCHKQRYQYAGVVKDSPASTASGAAVLIASSNFADSVIVDTVTGSAQAGYDSSASDLALTAAIKHQWNTLAKCVTNP